METVEIDVGPGDEPGGRLTVNVGVIMLSCMTNQVGVGIFVFVAFLLLFVPYFADEALLFCF